MMIYFKLEMMMKQKIALITMGVGIVLLSACASKPTYRSANFQPQIAYNSQGVPNYYQVRRGDTVGQIAKRFQMDKQTISKNNHLDRDNTIYTGQWLILWKGGAKQTNQTAQKTPPKPKNTTKTSVDTNNLSVPKPMATSSGGAAKANTTQKTTPNNTPVQQPASPSNVAQNTTTQSGFVYPVSKQSQIVRNFGAVRKIDGKSIETQGVWFMGKDGDAIIASQSGTVLYADQNSMPDASIAIRHADGVITEYRFIKDATIKQGQNVKAGQKIASMRSSSNGVVLTEFRMLKNGVYIDPMKMIQ